MRHIYIGDIQGCRKELELLLDKVRFDPSSDCLEPVGDAVNRGPDSLGALRLLRSLGAGGVLGNHDVHLLRVAAGRRQTRSEDTLDELLGAPDRDDLLGWLRDRPFCKELPGVLLVHAGLHPRWEDPVRELRGIDPHERHASARFATSVRCCAEDGTLAAEEAPASPRGSSTGGDVTNGRSCSAIGPAADSSLNPVSAGWTQAACGAVDSPRGSPKRIASCTSRPSVRTPRPDDLIATEAQRHGERLAPSLAQPDRRLGVRQPERDRPGR